MIAHPKLGHARHINMEEKTFYQDGSVIVTQTRFIVGSKTFAMRNISSVQIGLIEAHRTPYYIFIVIGICLAFIPQARFLGIIIVVIAGTIAYFLKDKYSVRITTNSGATDGLISENKGYIQQVVTALNDAIVYIG